MAVNISQILVRSAVFLYFIYLTLMFTSMSVRYFKNLGLLKDSRMRCKILTITSIVAALIMANNLIRIYISVSPYIIYKLYMECDPITRVLSLWLINF